MKTPKCWQDPWSEARVRLAKWYAAKVEISANGMNGGWLYDRNGKVAAQGWLGLYYKRRITILALIYGQEEVLAAEQERREARRVSPIAR